MKQKTNEERLLDLIDEVLNTRSDPNQLQVNEEQMLKLQRLNPNTLSEWRDETGPLIWVLLIPTTQFLMQAFLEGRISETQLLDETPNSSSLDALYLCSAIALPEIRQQGKTKALCESAIGSMLTNFPIRTLFVWTFTEEGRTLALKLAETFKLPLLFKN